ncbi:MAG: transposase [Granulosicoccus sp.]|nr:transposase [Granulosicoccus sp.]
MARKPRIHFRGAVYHVLLSGFETQPVFKSVADRNTWLKLTEDGVDRFGYQVHAYYLGRDVVQMAIRVVDVPLSKIMQNLSFRYTRYYNKKNQHQGQLFHGRYKAVLIDPDQYLADLVRFIHNAPLRQARASDPAQFKWSSHAAYADSRAVPQWLNTDTVLTGFGKNDKNAREAFCRFVFDGRQEGERQDLLSGTNGVRILGDERFVKKALKPKKVATPPITLNRLVKQLCREEGVPETRLADLSRKRHESQLRQLITYLAIELNLASLTNMAQRFNRDLTTMSRNQRHFRDRLNTDPALQKKVRSLRRQAMSSNA